MTKKEQQELVDQILNLTMTLYIKRHGKPRGAPNG